MIDSAYFEDKKAAYYTLGCKLNFAETSAIGRELADHGIRRARAGEQADVCVVNTCSVTELADKKCRQLIRRIRRQHPKAFVIVTGCYAQLKPDEVLAIDHVDLVLGAEQKGDVMRHLRERTAGLAVTTDTKRIRAFTPSCSADDRTRHFLKVQDGCRSPSRGLGDVYKRQRLFWTSSARWIGSRALRATAFPPSSRTSSRMRSSSLWPPAAASCRTSISRCKAAATPSSS